MRPDRFESFLISLAKTGEGARQVSTLRDAGDTKHPYGIAVTLGDREVRYQITAQSAPGERYEQPEEPVEGEPAPTMGDPVVPAGPVGPGEAEGWLAAVLAAARSPEVQRVERWSVREGAHGGHAGVTAHFHNGGRAFVRVM